MYQNGHGGQILNFLNTFDSVCDEIRLETQTENVFGNLISARLQGIRTSRDLNISVLNIRDISVLEISVLNNKNNLIEFKNFFNFFLHVDVYFGTE
jgi:hypothetical protein